MANDRKLEAPVATAASAAQPKIAAAPVTATATSVEQPKAATTAATSTTPAAATTTDASAITSTPKSTLPDYSSQITDLYGRITGRQPFSYDVDGDALYQQYKDRYTQNAKLSMKDTLAQTAMLTGGYGNSYGHFAGQQAYDRTMQGLTDKIPELQQNAFNMYQAEGNDLMNQYNIAVQGEQQQYGRQQDAYSQIAALISSTGYEPNEDELAAAGMNPEQANALRQAWIVANPMLAYQNGAITGDQYLTITGTYPPGYVPAGGGGGWDYGDGSDPGDGKTVMDYVTKATQMAQNQGSTTARAWAAEHAPVSTPAAEAAAIAQIRGVALTNKYKP